MHTSRRKVATVVVKTDDPGKLRVMNVYDDGSEDLWRFIGPGEVLRSWLTDLYRQLGVDTSLVESKMSEVETSSRVVLVG